MSSEDTSVAQTLYDLLVRCVQESPDKVFATDSESIIEARPPTP
jgi:hypothetical protein